MPDCKHSPPKVVFFDAAGTLIRLPRSAGARYRDIALRHGLDRPEAVFDDAFGAAWKAATPPPSTRTPRLDDDKGWWQALVWHVLDLCEAPGDFRRADFFEELYHEFTKPGVWELYPEVVEVLDALQPRFRLGVISNFDGRLRPILENLGIHRYFHHVVISSEVGADKPDPWIYLRALELAHVHAHEAAYVGDDPVADWAAASDAGLRSFPLDRPRNSLQDFLQYVLAEDKPS
jgi:putative hydrolase of the HAD superfamily